MNKKIFIGLSVFLFSIVLVATSALAKQGGGGGTYDITTIYTVAGSGDFTQKSTFDWSETPWLYFQLPSQAGDQSINTESWWDDPGGDPDVYVSMSHPNGTTNIWHSLSNWDSVKEEGNWSITAGYTTTSSNTDGTGSTTFTVNAEPLPPVVPEPISSILFLTGGATLGFRRYWKRRRSA